MPKKKPEQAKPETPGRPTKSRGRKFRPDGMGAEEKDKDQPEWKRFWALAPGTTLKQFVADSGMSPNENAAAGHIIAGRVTVGTAERRGPQAWLLQRPIECVRITDPNYVIVPPCVIRGGWKDKKVAIVVDVAA